MVMKTNLHLVFSGGVCTDAFAFYETIFKSKSEFRMTYGEAPPDIPIPEDAKNLVMHMSMPLGSMLLMGCDAMPGMTGAPIGGFHISIDMPDEAEVKRIYAALSEGGKVIMPLTPTFWSPLFGMCADKFGVEWMVSIPGPEMQSK
jgi:PhnB protein